MKKVEEDKISLAILKEYQVEGLDLPHLDSKTIAQYTHYFSQQPDMESKLIGHSSLGKPIHQYTIGHGPIIICAWSQMHGDEATATASLFDLMNLLTSQQNILPNNWKDKITLYLLPMLNPDGADLCTRENALGIDINRDALALQTLEGQLLDEFISSTAPHYAFNLHDQCDYYACEGKDGNLMPVTMAFLAPPYNAQRDIDEARYKAMLLIGALADHLQPMLNDQIAKYGDTFSARCFGDQIAARGISTILIESGYHQGDKNRQVARLGTFFSLTKSIEIISLSLTDNKSKHQQTNSKESFTNYKLPYAYDALPNNIEHAWADIILRNITLPLPISIASTSGQTNSQFQTDVLIRKQKRHDEHYIIYDIGDLSPFSALVNFDANDFIYSGDENNDLLDSLTPFSLKGRIANGVLCKNGEVGYRLHEGKLEKVKRDKK